MVKWQHEELCEQTLAIGSGMQLAVLMMETEFSPLVGLLSIAPTVEPMKAVMS